MKIFVSFICIVYEEKRNLWRSVVSERKKSFGIAWILYGDVMFRRSFLNLGVVWWDLSGKIQIFAGMSNFVNFK